MLPSLRLFTRGWNMGMADPDLTISQKHHKRSTCINVDDDIVTTYIYNFALAGPSVSAFSLSFNTLLKIFPLTLLGISSMNFTPPLSFL
jgi:hypothetical protein